jgi:hypothetical protein
MDLATFISESLSQIARGIENANDALADSTASVNPRGIQPSPSDSSKFYGYFNDEAPNKHYRIVEAIEFDVAVHAVKGTETKGGIGIMVGSIGIGSHGKSQAGNSSESRIKFTIPMVLPIKK